MLDFLNSFLLTSWRGAAFRVATTAPGRCKIARQQVARRVHPGKPAQSRIEQPHEVLNPLKKRVHQRVIEEVDGHERKGKCN